MQQFKERRIVSVLISNFLAGKLAVSLTITISVCASLLTDIHWFSFAKPMLSVNKNRISDPKPLKGPTAAPYQT